MDLWSVRFYIQDNFKNIFSEYVEDFEGYISSSLFVNEDKDKKKYTNQKNISWNKQEKMSRNNVFLRKS